MKTFFGCDSSDINKEMNSLCEDIQIDSMFVFEEKVYVFRVDKYWIFRFNRNNKERPLGPLIEGNIKISDKWKGIDGNDNRYTIRDNKIVAISYDKWTEMKPNGEIIKSETILPEKVETGEGSQVIYCYEIWVNLGGKLNFLLFRIQKTNRFLMTTTEREGLSFG